jgi:hypothetical protein
MFIERGEEMTKPKNDQWPNPNDQGSPVASHDLQSLAPVSPDRANGIHSLGFGHWSLIGFWVLVIGHFLTRSRA